MPTAHKPVVYPTANMLDFPASVTQCADVRQGPLGTCWLMAPLIAGEVTVSGFCDRLILHSTGTLAVVDVGSAPVTTNIPAHAHDRSGSRDGTVNSATLIEAAAQTVLGSRLEGHLPFKGFQFLFGSPGVAIPALPGFARAALRAAAHALDSGRPVVAATLPRRRSFALADEHNGRQVRITPNHVYAVVGHTQSKPGSDCSGGLLMRNPVLTGRTDIDVDALHLSADQLTEATMTLFIGPEPAPSRKGASTGQRAEPQ